MNKIDITKWKDEIIKSTCDLIKIPSVYEESKEEGKTFGKEPAKALEYMLDLGKKLGFKTKNIDGYCGYIEFGEGKELLGIIGHLDVVPEGEGWQHEPFLGIIEDGKIFGRGAIDDKGPVIASLYAMKAVMEQQEVNKRVRLILGLNEEREWKCIEYYKEHEESPTIGFSPDADFPCIYAENIKEQISENQFNIEVKDQKDNITLISHGVASHAAHPEAGINAISMILIIVNNILNKYNIKIELLDKFSELIVMQYNGENLGISFEDESGKLTLNVGNCQMVNNSIQIAMNLRIPVTIKIAEIEKVFKKLEEQSRELEISFKDKKEPLYIEKDNELIKILCDTFNEVTGKDERPIAIGGATYARAFKNCVSFGANMPGQKDMCHQVDEFIEIENLLTACQIYAEAIYKLAK